MRSLKVMFSVFAFAALTGGSVAFAQDAAKPESHEQHHPEGEAKEKAKDTGKNGDMMGSMKMDDMTGMMHQCMNMHKDGKMCDHETMQKCEEKMAKEDCQKMMKHAKAKVKTKDKAKQ